MEEVNKRTKPDNDVRITIRFPRDIWLKLRRMQENGEVDSIQSAVIQGLELITGKRGE